MCLQHLIIQDTHNSIEDAKIALALAKMKIEILDNFDSGSFCYGQPNLNPDVLINLNKSGSVYVIDSRENIEPYVKYGIGFPES